jgi:hypothetical protein
MRGFAMSRDGAMVAGGAVLPANVHKAFTWTAAGGSVLLDTVDPSLETQATVVTSDRSVVFGNSVYTVPTGGAIVWIDGQPGFSCATISPPRGSTPAGWRLGCGGGHLPRRSDARGLGAAQRADPRLCCHEPAVGVSRR